MILSFCEDVFIYFSHRYPRLNEEVDFRKKINRIHFLLMNSSDRVTKNYGLYNRTQKHFFKYIILDIMTYSGFKIKIPSYNISSYYSYLVRLLE